MPIVAPPWQPLPPGTEVDVLFRVREAGLLRKSPVALAVVLEGREMRLDAPVMAVQIVMDRAVLGIRHHDLYLALSILSMLLKKIRKQMALIHRPGSHRGGGYDFAVAIHGPVNFEGELGAHFALTDSEASGSVVDR
jgi:hypothetical protein